MKVLLVGESRRGSVLEATNELTSFGAQLGGEAVLVLVGDPSEPPGFEGRVYLGDSAVYGEFSPDAHRALVLHVVEREDPDYVVFAHSSYGWDLAPRVAEGLGAGQISEIVAIGEDGSFEVPAFNAKMRQRVKPQTRPAVLTIQAGAFSGSNPPGGPAEILPLEADHSVLTGSKVEFLGYEEAESGGVDLGKAEVVVSAGRGVGKAENIAMLAELARVLGGELGASRPVVDAGWVEHSRQVGSTGQTVSPKLYVACGISGAVQHLAGMRRSGFIVAVNKDPEAPIGEIADVLAVGDLNEIVPALVERLSG